MKAGWQRLNPLKRDGWDNWLQSHAEATVFHSTAWTRVLADTYGYKPVFWSRREERRFGLLPVLEVDSPLTGRRGVCLPFTDECQPLVSDAATYRGLLCEVLRYGEERGWKYLECRGGRKLLESVPASLSFYGHVLELSRDEGRLLDRFESSVRRAIRKAENAGVQVELSQSREAMEAFYALHGKTRKRHGLPPQPASFFLNIWEHMVSKQAGFVALAKCGEMPISASVFLHSGKRAIFKFGACNQALQHLRANNLVMWEAIKWYAHQGFESLDLGRTSIAQEGLRTFKRGWGTEERRIEYFKYDFRRDSFVLDKDSVLGWYNGMFKMMPVGLSRLIGTLAYKHLA
jgi:lipid II:glycine glycyltransferase (peptidoglycan interpeptide bridge formation enzyme)